jgi:hypothetical protein
VGGRCGEVRFYLIYIGVSHYTDRWGFGSPWSTRGGISIPVPAPFRYRVPAPLSPWGEFAPHPRFLAGNYPRVPVPTGKTAILIHHPSFVHQPPVRDPHTVSSRQHICSSATSLAPSLRGFKLLSRWIHSREQVQLVLFSCL